MVDHDTVWTAAMHAFDDTHDARAAIAVILDAIASHHVPMPFPDKIEDIDDDAIYEGDTRSLNETRAQPGETLLRKSAIWQPENDCKNKSVVDMLLHIYGNRRCFAVAPNGHTCPYLTVEEWSRIAAWCRNKNERLAKFILDERYSNGCNCDDPANAAIEGLLSRLELFANSESQQ